MKKIIVVCLLISLAVLPVFAMESWGGITVAPEFGWSTVKVDFGGQSEKIKSSSTNLMVAAEGANYFGQKAQFGIGYGFGVGFALSGTMEDQKVDVSNTPVSVLPKISFQYRNAFNDKCAIEVGIGFTHAYQSQTTTDSGISVKQEVNITSLFANANILFNFTDLIGIRAGLGLSTPIYTSSKISGNGMSIKIDATTTGVSIVPYVGIAFCY